MWCAQEVLDSILAAARNYFPWIGDVSTKYLPTELEICELIYTNTKLGFPWSPRYLPLMSTSTYNSS